MTEERKPRTLSAAMDRGHFSSLWNCATLYVEPCFGSETLSKASGFFWAHGSRTFLVTNWHVLSGRNPLDGKPMRDDAAIPNGLRFFSYRRVGGSTARKGSFCVDYVQVLVPLDDASTGAPRWLEHSSYGRHVDVAALDVTDIVADLHYGCANGLEGDIPKQLDPGQDVFIVGFPFGLISGAPAPVWKRGSIALDPTLNPEGLPKMLVDTATREGMSGSVVISMFPVPEHDTRRGDDPRPVYYKEYPAVIGVYSGRHYPDLEKAQLGIVWKRATVEAIVGASVCLHPASSPQPLTSELACSPSRFTRRSSPSILHRAISPVGPR